MPPRHSFLGQLLSTCVSMSSSVSFLPHEAGAVRTSRTQGTGTDQPASEADTPTPWTAMSDLVLRALEALDPAGTMQGSVLTDARQGRIAALASN